MKKKATRYLYLVRHGFVKSRDEIKRCLGRTDASLSREGEYQAYDLAGYFEKHPIKKIYSSPLKRCSDTAQIMSQGRYVIEIMPDLVEIDMGELENEPFSLIRENLEKEPEEGEKREEALKRFKGAIDEILQTSDGDVAVVSHAGVICCYLTEILGVPLVTSRTLSQPYGGFSKIVITPNGEKSVVSMGIMPTIGPPPLKCENIWRRYKTPEDIKKRAKIVCQRAVVIAEAINDAGGQLDVELIRSAALLQDVKKYPEKQDEEAARVARSEGYPRVAEIIKQRADIDKEISKEELTEAEVLYFANLMIFEDRPVTREEFAQIEQELCEKAEDPKEAYAEYKEKIKRALAIEKKINIFIARSIGL